MGRGDHFKVHRVVLVEPIAYDHHGIDLGDGWVIHFSGSPTDKANARVRRDRLEDVLEDGEYELVEYARCDPVATTIRRAESRLGRRGYDLLFNNCEHFATWCKIGRARSGQVKEGAHKAVALVGAASAAGDSPMPSPSFLLNIASLGVGLYNAWQLHQVREREADVAHDLREVRGLVTRRFAGLEALVQEQGEALRLLLDGQTAVDDRLRRLGEGMAAGFAQVHTHLLAEAARNELHDFRERLEELLGQYRPVRQALEHGESPDQDDARELLRASRKLDAWLKARTADQTTGAPERAPYLVARGLALRAMADAERFLDKKWPQALAEQRALREVVAAEAWELSHNKTLYEIVCVHRPLLEQYAALHVALDDEVKGDRRAARAATLSDEMDLVGAQLAGLRPRSADDSPPPGISLRTIGDYRWYVDYAGVDATQFDVHSVRAVSASELLGVVGAPAGLQVAEADLEALRTLALPGVRDNLATTLVGVFAWAEKPAPRKGETADRSVAEVGSGQPAGDRWKRLEARIEADSESGQMEGYVAYGGTPQVVGSGEIQAFLESRALVVAEWSHRYVAKMEFKKMRWALLYFVEGQHKGAYDGTCERGPQGVILKFERQGAQPKDAPRRIRFELERREGAWKGRIWCRRGSLVLNSGRFSPDKRHATGHLTFHRRV